MIGIFNSVFETSFPAVAASFPVEGESYRVAFSPENRVRFLGTFSRRLYGMGDPVVFFEITGPDGTALQSFYSEVFGWTVESRPFPGYAYISTDQAGVQAGGIREEQASPERVLYIRVPDLQAAVDRVVAQGGTVLIPPTEVPGIITFALFKDPAGNTTGLVKG